MPCNVVFARSYLLLTYH